MLLSNSKIPNWNLENLVPSCSICNRTLKRDIDSIVKFHISINGLNIFDENNFKIRLIPFEKAKKRRYKACKKSIPLDSLLFSEKACDINNFFIVHSTHKYFL